MDAAGTRYRIVTQVDGEQCMVRYYTTTQAYFDKPLSSRKFGIILVDDHDLEEEVATDVVALMQMCYKIPVSNKFVLVPLVQ